MEMGKRSKVVFVKKVYWNKKYKKMQGKQVSRWTRKKKYGKKVNKPWKVLQHTKCFIEAQEK